MFDRGLHFVSGRCSRILEEANTAQRGAGMVSTTEACGLKTEAMLTTLGRKGGNSAVPKVDSDSKASSAWKPAEGKDAGLG